MRIEIFPLLKKIASVILLLLSGSLPGKAQYAIGCTGLLHTPDANMQPDVVFMGGANYLPKQMTPDTWNYHTANYFFNITILPFLEVAYRCTLLKDKELYDKGQQDRSVSLRLRLLKERRILPAVVAGSNDAFTGKELNMFKDTDDNRYFSSVYAVATKHFDFRGHVCGITAGSYFFSKNTLYKGVFGGVRYTPSFLKPASLIVEYDSKSINAGMTGRLARHFSIHAFTYDFKAVSCGLRYEIQLRK